VASFTVRIGVLLVVLGVASYVTTGAASVTALIPAVVGAALAACGLSATRSTARRPTALRVAVAIAGLGLMATASSLWGLAAVLASGGAARPAAIARASMALILLVYLAFATRAFVFDVLRTGRR
jgi:hypothetical protein